jgi:hypothetical protein
LAAVADPTAAPGSQSGLLSGGPVLLTEQTTNPDLPGTTPESGTLTCRVQVNQGTHTGSGPLVQGHGTGVLTAGPATINYTASETDVVFLCAEFTDDSDGVTYYWDDTSTTPRTTCSVASPARSSPSCRRRSPRRSRMPGAPVPRPGRPRQSSSQAWAPRQP